MMVYRRKVPSGIQVFVGKKTMTKDQCRHLKLMIDDYYYGHWKDIDSPKMEYVTSSSP